MQHLTKPIMIHACTMLHKLVPYALLPPQTLNLSAANTEYAKQYGMARCGTMWQGVEKQAGVSHPQLHTPCDPMSRYMTHITSAILVPGA